jgi:hypothetical protein
MYPNLCNITASHTDPSAPFNRAPARAPRIDPRELEQETRAQRVCMLDEPLYKEIAEELLVTLVVDEEGGTLGHKLALAMEYGEPLITNALLRRFKEALQERLNPEAEKRARRELSDTSYLKGDSDE